MSRLIRAAVFESVATEVAPTNCAVPYGICGSGFSRDALGFRVRVKVKGIATEVAPTTGLVFPGRETWWAIAQTCG